MTSPVPLRLPTWRHHLAAESAPKLPFGLAEMLDEGKRVLLIGRASGQNGKKSRQYAANDLFECADQLAHRAGIDLARSCHRRGGTVRRPCSDEYPDRPVYGEKILRIGAAAVLIEQPRRVVTGDRAWP